MMAWCRSRWRFSSRRNPGCEDLTRAEASVLASRLPPILCRARSDRRILDGAGTRNQEENRLYSLRMPAELLARP